MKHFMGTAMPISLVRESVARLVLSEEKTKAKCQWPGAQWQMPNRRLIHDRPVAAETNPVSGIGRTIP